MIRGSAVWFLLLGSLMTINECQSRAVNISNTWTLPQEGFSVFYRFFRDKISWFEADAVCQFHHANLVTGLISNSTCDDIVIRLQNRYKSDVSNCSDINGKEKPAYECSGIMIRGVNKDLQFAWSMTKYKENGAFSLAYLRCDQWISSILDYVSGFIIYPHSKTPSTKKTYNVLCAFPFNANTDRREHQGCGKHSFDRSQMSDYCRQQNITSFEDWKTRFHEIMEADNFFNQPKQCGFDMTKPSAIKDFDISLEAKRYLQSNITKYAFRNNELRMQLWDDLDAKTLPIEAFFYLLESPHANLLAEKYQDDFYHASGGETVPIVGIRLPTADTMFEVESHERLNVLFNC